jgi:hypothetical protein
MNTQQLNRIQALSATTAATAAVETLGNSVADLIEQIQGAQYVRDMAVSLGMEAELLPQQRSFSPLMASYSSTGLWLEITNYVGNFSYYNLHHAMNQVYAILTKTNLLDPSWTIEMELWPMTNQTSVLPFALANYGRPILFVRAEDWTGVTHGGNTVPDWWLWKYFGTIDLADSSLDCVGNPLVYDYTNGINPNPLTANALSVATCKNTPVAITLSGYDQCGDDPATFLYALVSIPTNGYLTGVPPDLTYTPASPTITGMDSFTYKVGNAWGGDAATNTVTITVGNVVSVYEAGNATEPSDANGTGMVPGYFSLQRQDACADALTIYFKLTGTAINGVDYTNVPGYANISAGNSDYYLEVDPKYDNLLEFSEPVTLTLVNSNNYTVDPAHATATIYINDNFTTNLLTLVTDIKELVGIDYDPVVTNLIVSANYNNGLPNNFLRLGTNGGGLWVTNWSEVAGLGDEVKLAVVKKTASGFTNGEIYFGTGVNGVVGKLSPDGTVSNLTWAVLSTNDDSSTLLRGGLYVDQTGTFSNNLIVVTGNGPDDGGEVWQVNAAGGGTRLANITNYANRHLEGVITLTNDAAKWGPWSGKIVTGAESALDTNRNFKPLIHAINTNGAVATFALGIAPEDFDLIPTNQDLYLCDPNQGLFKMSRSLFTNYVGDLLITQSGDGNQGITMPTLFIVHWDGTNFVTHSIFGADLGVSQLEHVTFAPINLPSQPFP